MLSKKEKIVMQIIYDKAKDKRKSFITTEQEIFDEIPPKVKITLDEMRVILRQLAIDNYFEMTHSEKKGQPLLVIKLNKNGEAFEREIIQQKRTIAQRLLITLICAIITAIVSLIFKNLL